MMPSITPSVGWLLGPEAALAAFTLGLFGFCARVGSGENWNVLLVEKLIWALPFVITLVAFATACAPGARTWGWLGRALFFGYIALLLCAGRLIAGLGPGAKGQDAAFILVIVFGSAAMAMATSVCGAWILAEKSPAFGLWFQSSKLLGSLLVLVSAVPIAVGLGVVATIASSLLLGTYVAFTRR